MKLHNYISVEVEQRHTGKYWRYDVTACGLRGDAHSCAETVIVTRFDPGERGTSWSASPAEPAPDLAGKSIARNTIRSRNSRRSRLAPVGY